MLNWINTDVAGLQAQHPRHDDVAYFLVAMHRGWKAKRNRSVLCTGQLSECLDACQKNANASMSKSGLGEHIVSMMEDLRQEIRPAREAAGLTQTQAGQLIGSRMQYWSDIECGRRTATIEQLIKMVNAVGLDVTLVIEPKRKRKSA